MRPLKRERGPSAKLAFSLAALSFFAAGKAWASCAFNTDGVAVVAVDGDTCVANGGAAPYQPGAGTGNNYFAPAYNGNYPTDAGSGFLVISSGLATASINSPNAATIQATSDNAPAVYATGGGGSGPFGSGSGQINATGALTISTTGASSQGVWSDTGGAITLGQTTITTTGGSSQGLFTMNSYEVQGQGGTITVNGPLQVTTSGYFFANGAEADDGAIFLNGASSTFNINGSQSWGLYSNALIQGGVNSVVTIAVGANASNGGGINATGSGVGGSILLPGTTNVATSGSASYGVFAESGGLVSLGVSTIQTSGDGALGLFAENGGQIGAAGLTVITTTGAGTAQGQSSVNLFSFAPVGVLADGTGSSVDLAAATIQTSGAGAHGLYVSNLDSAIVPGGSAGAISVSGPLSVTTGGDGAVGLFASQGGGITATSSANITTTGGAAALNLGSNTAYNGVGLSAYGVLADGSGSTVALADAAINTSGAGAHGLYAGDLLASGSGGAITVNGALNATVTGAGADALRADASGARITLNGAATIVASGAGGAGVYIASGGEVNVKSTLSVQASGGASGVVLSGAGESFSATYGGSISAAGNVLQIVNATGFSASFSGFSLSSSGGDLIFADPSSGTVNLTNTTADAGSGNLVNATQGSAVTLNASASTLTGAILADAASTATVALTSGSVWNVTGNSNMTSLSNDASSIIFAPPSGNAFKTLTVGSYVGSGGSLTVNAFLAPTGSVADELVINGGTATGTTSLYVRVVGGAGGLTTGNGIPVIVMANGGSTSLNAFRLASPLVVGGYDYTLVREPNQDFYLQSSSIDPSPPPPPPPTGSLSALAVTHESQIITGRILSSILLGANEQINCSDCASGFASFGSFALGGHGRWGLTDRLTLLAGFSFDQFSARGVKVSSAPMIAASLRYDLVDWGRSRPFFEIGASGAPYELASYTRNYVSNGAPAAGSGTSVDREVSTFARAGWVMRLTPKDEFAVFGDLSRNWQYYGGYVETAGVGNPVVATVAAGVDELDIGKIGAQYTHLFGSNIEANINGGVAHGFGGGAGVAANFSGYGPATGAAAGASNWLEFGGRLGYRYSPRLVVDAFLLGTFGGQPAGDSVHGGVGLRYAF